ncbi:histone-lysine N-methyltransferase NSD2-like isoform X2 [Phymastichus coffea]|uniref:histone-lysine N-methyltransferase NSD2-like isoform X2 n=1 Tax=Phymastichus coffea TaxID=108790 RepID=UPI00273BDA4A|nr:histone-lysine N-methyltransferase NSD2-like isoform X2 [Phymastichus coffea]
MEFCEEDSLKQAHTPTEDAQNDAKEKDKIVLQPIKYFPIFSRYGRTIKPKSPSIIPSEFPKITKMPKNNQETPMEDNSIKEDTSLIMDETNSTFDSSTKNEDEKVNYEDLQAKSPWKLGQLVWARIGNFPFWPGIVTLDPNTMTFVSVKGRSYMLHVRYCADKDRHSWVPFASVIPFLGLDDFEKRSKEVTPDIRKKEPKYAAAFVIKPSTKLQWDDAVAEATRLMTKSIEKRIVLFNPENKEKNSLDKSSNNSIKTEENVKKRKLSLSTEEAVSKKSKLQNGEIDDAERLESKPIVPNLNIEAPPTPPSSHKDSSDEAPTKFKSKRGINRDGKDGVFEIFCERTKHLAQELDPEATEADIKEYLYDMWNNMKPEDRSKYRADYLHEDDMRMYALDGEDYDEYNYSDSEEKLAHKQRSKADFNRSKDEPSDQEETTSIESENLDKSVRRRRTKPRRESSDRDEVVSIDSDDKSIKIRKSKITKDDANGKEDSSLLIMDLAKRRAYKLFKGMKNERVCQICEQPGKLIRCKGPCYSYFHLECVKPGDSSPEPSEAEDAEEHLVNLDDLNEAKVKTKKNYHKEEDAFDDENFRCIDCLSGIAPPCFVCHERDAERIKCSVIACGKHYHADCLKHWPQVQWQGERLNCPYHICHTCSSDDPQNGHPRAANERFIRCVRCPSTYHASFSCLPAGSNIITASQIVCPKHYKSPHPPVNATWCFLCTEGGSLICCDTCPTSFHLECLGIDAPEGGFICEDCETGRLPLYGEVVWVKLGTYRWWPSVICYPQEIPMNIAQRPHKTGEFCVMFFGTRDYYWVHRGKAFLFQDGDATGKVKGSKQVEESYRKAMQEAKIVHEQLNEEKKLAKSRDSNIRNLKPPPYVKLKVNKPVGNVKIPEADSMVACNCDPSKPNPCAPDSDCLNRILMTECSPDACPAGSKCQNQFFVQRKYPAMEPVHTDGRGWGLKTLEFISEGQFIIEYVGEIIDEAEYRLRLQQKQERKNDNYYFLTIDNNRMIDAEPKGNLSRFMNHSCLPNSETQKWTVNGDTRIGLFALRDIQAGEELTFNYNLSCDGETRKPCLCKAPNCSGFIGLKASKQQMSLVQQKKMEKAEKVRKYKRNKKTLFCWSCNGKINNNEDVMRCDQKTCGKVYHTKCIAVEDGSEDQVFHCPWHFCAECFKRTSLRCMYCCNAFCQLHTQGNVYEHPENGGFICYKHPLECPNYVEMDMGGEALMDEPNEAGEGLMDGMDEDVACSDNHILVNGHTEVGEPIGASSPKSTLQPDETSPRGTIVEVYQKL